MPTAAMICWQVGDLDSARRYIAEALPLNTGPARIARVVLLSAAAGVALADADLAAAADHGTHREPGSHRTRRRTGGAADPAPCWPGRCSPRATPAAAAQATAALQAALTMSIESPLAIGLETAALVLHSAGTGTQGEAALHNLLAAAASIRGRGDRPPPATLAPAVSELRASLGRDVRRSRPRRETPPAGPASSWPRCAAQAGPLPRCG